MMDNPSQITIWVIIAVVLALAIIWLFWLLRFHSRPPKYQSTLYVGLAALAIGTSVIVLFLVFGLQQAIGNKPSAFWFEIGCTVSTCLNATCMVGSVSYSVSHLLIRGALGFDHNSVERTALQSPSRP